MTPLQYNFFLGIVSLDKYQKFRESLQKGKKNCLESRNFEVIRKD